MERRMQTLRREAVRYLRLRLAVLRAEAEARSPKPSLETTGAGQFWRDQVAVHVSERGAWSMRLSNLAKNAGRSAIGCRTAVAPSILMILYSLTAQATSNRLTLELKLPCCCHDCDSYVQLCL